MKRYGLIISSMLLLVMSNSYAQSSSRTEIKSDFSKLTVPPDRISYFVEVSAGKAPYEVRINDIPLVSSVKPNSLTFPVNSAILESGEQTIRVIQQQPDSDLRVKVTAQVFSTGELVKTDSLILQSGNPKSTFKAEVPYRLEGWQKSLDIPADAAFIAKAETWYKKMATFLKEKKGEAFMAAISPAEWTSFTTGYLSAEEALQQHHSWVSFIDKGGFEIVDPGKGSIEIVGNGKLVHLVYPDRNGGLAIITHNGQTTFLDVYLHLPEDTQELKPVMINYRQMTTDFRRYLKSEK